MVTANLLVAALAALGHPQTVENSIRLEAARPVLQQGSTGEDRKLGSRYGQVLGHEWGGDAGDFAEYAFTVREFRPSRLRLRYARNLEGAARLQATLDGKLLDEFRLPATGGWGDAEGEFREVSIPLPPLALGAHRLRLTVPTFKAPVPLKRLPSVSVLELVGNRSDKNTVGHGKNVALYTGLPSRFFYATQDLTDVFSAVDGATLDWAPDHVLVTPQGDPPGNANLDEITLDSGSVSQRESNAPAVFEQRQVCVTEDDVTVSRIFVTNLGNTAVRHRIEVVGDCRGSRDYRGKPGGEKRTVRKGNEVVLTDRNVFPSVLKDGLAIAVGANRGATEIDAGTPGAYRMVYDLDVPAKGTASLTMACAIDPQEAKATDRLHQALAEADPMRKNRDEWKAFYADAVPSFTSSDRGLDELYAFRWFLLRFSRAGGDLGYLKYPVVLEGRQAFQTYCCYSAPFMAFDLNWAVDPQFGYGQLANMGVAAYDDGRFPWYATPETNRVPLDHPSATGCSALPWAAWRFYEVHRRADLLAPIYPAMRANVEWWVRDRDPDGNGLFSIDHQLETGMDDLHRRWKGPAPKRYEAIDATAYAVLNLRAVANMARVLGKKEDAARYAALAEESAKAMQTEMWDPMLARYRDRNPDDGELTDYNSITIFYPLFAGVSEKANLSLIVRYLLNPAEYALPWPTPALSKADPEFDVHRYWAGPTWPATNSHVAQGFAETAKRIDRAHLPQAAALFKRVAALHLRPRADFYEHYDPLTGAPLSDFRDYMHSWWIDTIIRHVAGLTPQDDGSLVIDPLPMGLKRYALRGAPYGKHRVDVLFNEGAKGLVVRIDGRAVRRLPDFVPGGEPVKIPFSPAADL